MLASDGKPLIRLCKLMRLSALLRSGAPVHASPDEQNQRAYYGHTGGAARMQKIAALITAIFGVIALSSVLAQPVVGPLLPQPTMKQSEAARASITPSNSKTPVLSAQDVNAWLDGYMPYALAQGDIAGAVVTIVKDGQVLTSRGYG